MQPRLSNSQFGKSVSLGKLDLLRPRRSFSKCLGGLPSTRQQKSHAQQKALGCVTWLEDKTFDLRRVNKSCISGQLPVITRNIHCQSHSQDRAWHQVGQIDPIPQRTSENLGCHNSQDYSDAQQSQKHQSLSTIENVPPKWFTVRGRAVTKSRKLMKFQRKSAAKTLLEYLKLDGAARSTYHKKNKSDLRPTALPHVLLHHLHLSSLPEESWSDFDRSFRMAALESLASKRINAADLEVWSWIISANEGDEMARRFLSTTCSKPAFLLLLLLHEDIRQVRSLKRILIYVWDEIIPKPYEHSLPSNSTLRPPDTSEDEMDSILQRHMYTILLSRLLYHSRRLWPGAMISISHMVAPYFESIQTRKCDTDALDPKTLSQFSTLLNHFIRLLALPAVIGPLRSMEHNWAAQKVLIQVTGMFKHPLILDNASYRAVVRVLAASKKSDREIKAAMLRTRSWPPWRVDQDGMDARRAPEDDLSRVNAGLRRAQEAGYRLDDQDEAMRVYGGSESDGTPTIHTRKLTKRRASNPASSRLGNKAESTHTWAARIESTRDIQEAWSAFTEFKRLGLKPNLKLYLAMFQKLNYDIALRSRDLGTDIPRGDLREVISPANDNYTAFYRVRLQPPSSDQLYEDMLKAGLKPQGRCLVFLLDHARTMGQGFRYLRDSDVPQSTVKFLAGGPNTTLASSALSKISDSVFDAFIRLSCRFAPRAKTVLEPTESELYGVSEPKPRPQAQITITDSLHHVFFLLQSRHPKAKTGWFALLKALARPGLVTSGNLAGESDNDRAAWNLSVSAMAELEKFGLELDPQGFIIICQGFEHFARLYSESLGNSEAIAHGAKILSNAFARLSENPSVAERARYYLPGYLHPLSGPHLHAYVRAMAQIANHSEILHVLRWMVENSDTLKQLAGQARNAYATFGRTLIASAICVANTEHEVVAQALIERLDWLREWCSEHAIAEYKSSALIDSRLETAREADDIEGAEFG